MGNQAIFEYLQAIVGRYERSTKKEKSTQLNEAGEVTRLSRKQLIRRLGGLEADSRRPDRRGRPLKYDPEILAPHIRFLWVAMERITARRMKAAYSDWLQFYDQNQVTPQIKIKLMQMSVSTLERFLSRTRQERKASKGLSTTCPARYMKNKIPLNTLDQKVTRPGFTQADTVAHCGNTTAGAYISSITVTDVWSAWTENRSLFTKKATGVRKQFHDIENSLPFDLLGVNTDSGSEFLNNEVANFMWRRGNKRPIVFTRSRPYKKNDNCYVEQKNYTHVRELFGYERMEDEKLVEKMNEIYKDYWNPLQNFFLPTFKLKEKIRIGARIVKKYDRPKTPYDRLMSSLTLTQEQKRMLKHRKDQLNPFELKKGLEIKLHEFFQMLKQDQIREVA